MSNKPNDLGTCQDRWARFRFAIIGPLLAAPPDSGQLQVELEALSKKQWHHPITGLPTEFAISSIERWLYKARKEQDPVGALRTKRRTDAGKSTALTQKMKLLVQAQYREHPSWSYQLHFDNLGSLIRKTPELGKLPSYNSVRRYLKSNGYYKHRGRKLNTPGAILAAERLGSHEVRSYEVEAVHGLWHLDFHHGSRKILGRDGKWHKPLLLAILDDRSRLICHAQWYLDETVETLVHGVMQALQKRALPRALMSDNGSAMVAAEFKEGLERLGILHQPTLPHSPHQNGKQEVFWVQIEGRLMAMLEGETELTLALLNQATIAWIEFEYHRKLHSEIAATPLDRYLQGPDVGRPSPNSAALRHVFCTQVHRKQRKSDGTFSLHAKRYEVPSQYRHLEYLHIRYARWDLSMVTLVDPHSNTLLSTLYPLDKSGNADGMRRAYDNKGDSENHISEATITPSGMAPLLKELMAEFAATGLPPAYLPKGENP